MSQPDPYVLDYSFVGWQISNPTRPLPADKLEVEFNAVSETLDQVLTNIALIQRDDGEIANETIGYDQLKPELTLGVREPSAWLTSTAYVVRDTVFNGASLYRAVTAHTSGVFATDLAAGKWELLATIEGGVSVMTDLTATAWRVFYSDGSGDVTELALGANGTFLKSNGASSAPSFATPSGSGDVIKVGTPVNNQLGVWTGDGSIEGDASLTFDTATDTLAVAASGKFAFGAVNILDDTAGTTTLSNIDALDATTESTIEAAIDTLANLVSIQGRTVTLADAGADAILGWDDSASAYQNLSAADVRTAIGLVIGTHVQAWDADLDTYAGITPSANIQTFLGAADYAAMRTQLGLVIGTNVQAFDADLTTWAGLTPSANAQSLVTAADYSAMRTLLGLVIGTNVQAFDADLTTWAGLTPSANAQSLVTAANYAAMRGLLDLEAGTDFYSIAAADAAFQPKDSDLTTIAGLTATTDNFIQSKSSAWASRTPTQVTADLIVMVGDGGSGGSKGLVPAPTTGDATKFLRGDATWQTIPGGGDALVANPLSQFAATTSLQLKGVISDETGSGALVFAESPTLVTPALGTPASGTLTNCTGLPLAGVVDSTSEALGVGSLEVGHASDTTLTRVSAGLLAVEGVNLVRSTDIDNTKIATITFVIDGGGSAITTGIKGYLEIPFACTITRVTALADQSGSIVVDVWKDTYANYPPVDADSITASAPVTISSAVKSQDATLTGWTTSISAGDVLGFNVDSITTCQRVTVSIRVTKT
jgi:hypothetical protein